MVNPSNEDLLTEWCKWMLQQAGPTDTSNDWKAGTIVQTENENGSQKYHNDIWFIPGTWGDVLIPDRDQVKVPFGRKLFVIAGSSHVTPPELPNGTPNTPANLKAQLAKIDALWLSPSVHVGPTVDKLAPVALTRVETSAPIQVNINAGSKYTVLTKGNGQAGVSGNQDMMASASVCTVNLARGDTFITIAGQSRKDETTGSRGEKEYNVHVRYKITVR